MITPKGIPIKWRSFIISKGIKEGYTAGPKDKLVGKTVEEFEKSTVVDFKNKIWVIGKEDKRPGWIDIKNIVNIQELPKALKILFLQK